MSNVKFINRTSFIVYVECTNGSSFTIPVSDSVNVPDNESGILYAKAKYYRVEENLIIHPNFGYTDKIQEDNMIYYNSK